MISRIDVWPYYGFDKLNASYIILYYFTLVFVSNATYINWILLKFGYTFFVGIFLTGIYITVVFQNVGMLEYHISQINFILRCFILLFFVNELFYCYNNRVFSKKIKERIEKTFRAYTRIFKTIDCMEIFMKILELFVVISGALVNLDYLANFTLVAVYFAFHIVFVLIRGLCNFFKMKASKDRNIFEGITMGFAFSINLMVVTFLSVIIDNIINLNGKDKENTINYFYLLCLSYRILFYNFLQILFKDYAIHKEDGTILKEDKMV